MTPIQTKRISVATILYAIGGILIVGLLLTYVLFQARMFIAGPQIALREEYETLQNNRQITLAGTAQNITEITVNGRAIVTDEAGHFAESIVLENGYTIVRIAARDRYGRETYIEQPFVYTPLSLYTP